MLGHIICSHLPQHAHVQRDSQQRIIVGQAAMRACVRSLSLHEQPCMQGWGVSACFLLECCIPFYIAHKRSGSLAW
jgi:hypothetical protein